MRRERLRPDEDIAMKILLAALVAGSFVLAGVARAEDAPSSPQHATPSAIHLIAASNSADRQTYVRKKNSGLEEWRSKIGHFNARMEASATAADQAASREIQGAWTHVEQASSKLDSVGEDGWDNAKLAYEHASRDLQATWARVGPAKN
jgi:hypothetical protein